MLDKLKDYIIHLFLLKDISVLEKDNYLMKYEQIMPYITNEEYSNQIIAYILRAAGVVCNQENGLLSDKNILDIMSFDFCIDRAYEYYLFMQNDHENEADLVL